MMTLLLIWKNCARKKSRTVLTCLSVAIAFFLFTSLSAINHALTLSNSDNNQYRLMTNHKVSLTRSLPIHYQNKIAAIDGVKQVSFASWFGGYYQNEKNQLAMMAVDHLSYFDIFDEYLLTKQQLQSWKNTRSGVIIGQELAEEFGWRIGDSIPLSSSIWMNKEGQFSWSFIVSGIYQAKDASVDNRRVFFQHRYFDEARAYGSHMVSWFSTQIEPNADTDSLSLQLDAVFANSGAPTRTITEQVFIKEQAQQFVDMAMVINIVVFAVFFTLLLIVCNTMVQINRERLSESAMMKALGFSSYYLTWLLFLESLWLILTGATIGTLLSMVSLSSIAQLFSDFLPGIALDYHHIVTVVMISIVTAVIASLAPAVMVTRLSISKTLGAIA